MSHSVLRDILLRPHPRHDKIIALFLKLNKRC